MPLSEEQRAAALASGCRRPCPGIDPHCADTSRNRRTRLGARNEGASPDQRAAQRHPRVARRPHGHRRPQTAQRSHRSADPCAPPLLATPQATGTSTSPRRPVRDSAGRPLIGALAQGAASPRVRRETPRMNLSEATGTICACRPTRARPHKRSGWNPARRSRRIPKGYCSMRSPRARSMIISSRSPTRCTPVVSCYAPSAPRTRSRSSASAITCASTIRSDRATSSTSTA